MFVDAWQTSQLGFPAMPAGHELCRSLSTLDRKPHATTTFVDNMLCHHLGGHDGAALKKWDIWIGDYDDHTIPVNGKSVDDFFMLADLNGRTNPRVPDTMRGPARHPEYLHCHQCHMARSLTVVCIPFMDGMVWALPFSLGQRKVFTIIKKSSIHPGNWMFWSTKGFYRAATSGPMLASSPTRRKTYGDATSCSKRSKSTLKRSRDSPLKHESDAKRIKKNDPGRIKDWSYDTYDSDSDYDIWGIVPRKPSRSASINQPHRAQLLVQDEAVESAVSGVGAGKRRDPASALSSLVREIKVEESLSRKHRRTTTSSLDGSSNKLGTPRLEDVAAKAVKPFQHQEPGAKDVETYVTGSSAAGGTLQSSETAQSTILPEPATTTAKSRLAIAEISAASSAKILADPTPAPSVVAAVPPAAPIARDDKLESASSPLRFCLWLNVDWNPNSSVVYLDEAMSIESVYERVANVLSRKLEGKAMVCLTVRLFVGEEPFMLDIESGNADAWEVLLDLMRPTRDWCDSVEGWVTREE